MPELHKLLINYLEDDFENVSKKLEETLINTLWLDGIKNGLFSAVKKTAQNQLLKPDIFDLFIDTANSTIQNKQTEEYLEKRRINQPQVDQMKKQINSDKLNKYKK